MQFIGFYFLGFYAKRGMEDVCMSAHAAGKFLAHFSSRAYETQLYSVIMIALEP